MTSEDFVQEILTTISCLSPVPLFKLGSKYRHLKVSSLADNTRLKRLHHVFAVTFCANRRMNKRISEIATKI